MTAAPSDHPYSDEVVVIRPNRSWLQFDLPLLWKFRDLLFAFAWRDIRLRYRQTLLGVAWVVLQPLLGALIFTVVFGFIAKMPANGTPYIIITYSGLLGWTFFASCLTRISGSLVSNADLIRKVFFPRLLLPFGVVPCLLLDFLVGAALMAILLVVYGVVPTWTIVFLPVSVLLLLAISTGVGLMTGSFAVRYRDMQYILPLAIQLLMYASPVGYATDAIPASLKPYYGLNPLVAPLELMRASLTGSPRIDVPGLLYSSGFAATVLVAGLIVFRLTERKFADVI
jgi:lipopolysaccharide transport system permease protein